MADLNSIVQRLQTENDQNVVGSLLSKAKIALLKANALTPSPNTPTDVLSAARTIYEAGALYAITSRQPDAFVRYYFQLLPFWSLPESRLPVEGSQREKITGLYLLLLLVKGDYAGFHTELEGIEMRGVDAWKDKYLGYPVKIERWLMEGAYDRVWGAMREGEVPGVEFSVFQDVRAPVSRFRPAILSLSFKF